MMRESTEMVALVGATGAVGKSVAEQEDLVLAPRGRT